MAEYERLNERTKASIVLRNCLYVFYNRWVFCFLDVGHSNGNDSEVSEGTARSRLRTGYLTFHSRR